MGTFSIWHWLVILIFLSPLILGLIFMGPQRKVVVRHTQSSMLKSGYFGFCWTYFFFGWLVPVFRGEIGIGVLHLILTVVTFGIFQVVMPFLYNKQYMTRLLTSGWNLADSEETNQKARIKLNIAF